MGRDPQLFSKIANCMMANVLKVTVLISDYGKCLYRIQYHHFFINVIFEEGTVMFDSNLALIVGPVNGL